MTTDLAERVAQLNRIDAATAHPRPPKPPTEPVRIPANRPRPRTR